MNSNKLKKNINMKKNNNQNQSNMENKNINKQSEFVPFEETLILQGCIGKPYSELTDKEKQARANFEEREARLKEKRKQQKQKAEEERRKVSQYEIEYRQTVLNVPNFKDPNTFNVYLQKEQRPSEYCWIKNIDRQQAYTMLKQAFVAQIKKTHRTPIYDVRIDEILKFGATWMVSGNRQRAGLMMRGGTGCGKTTILNAMRLMFSKLELGKDVRYITANQVVDLWDKKDRESFSRLCNIPLLFIDDLGTEPIERKDFGNENTPILRLLDERYVDRRTTIVTTNLIKNGEKDQLERYGDRMFSRFAEMFDMVYFPNTIPDYRTL